jgi:hypothetical protein
MQLYINRYGEKYDNLLHSTDKFMDGGGKNRHSYFQSST